MRFPLRLLLVSLLFVTSACVGREFAARRHSFPVPESPAEPALPAARWLWNVDLVATEIKDPDGAPLGQIEDALVAPETGDVVALVAAASVRGKSVRFPIEFGVLEWETKPDVAPSAVAPSDLPPTARQGEFAELLAGQGLSSVTGQVIDAQVDPRGARIVKIHDQENLVHRVLVEPAPLVERGFAGLEAGQAIEVEGVLTRDGRGKLLVASKVQSEGGSIALRDASGTLLWEPLTEGLISARALTTNVVRAEGTEYAIRAWLVNREEERLGFVCIESDGELCGIPWDELTVGIEDGRWRFTTGVALEDLLRLPWDRLEAESE